MLRVKSIPLTILLLGLFGCRAYGTERTDTWVNTPQTLNLSTAQRQQWFDASNAVLFLSHATDLVNATMGSCYGYAPGPAGGFVKDIHTCGAEIDKTGKATGKSEVPNFPGSDNYLIIHVVRWKDLAAGSTVPQVDKQNWYVVSGSTTWSDADFATNCRIFGKKQVYLLYVDFNMSSSAHYSMRYDFKTISKLPVFLDNLIQLGQLAGIGTAGGAAAITGDGWNVSGFNVPYVPSDIQITATVLPQVGTEAQLDSKKFDNEGKYHLDFSVGVPIKKIKDVSYTSSSNTLVPASVNKANLLALVDVYPWAVDLKSNWSKYPHFVGGVAMASQPLHTSLFAIGYGPVVAHFYAGAILNVKQLPKTGGNCSATPTSAQAASGLSKQICPEFSFGLNVAVGAIAQSLKANKK
jgi:hypothetical protein